MILFAEVTSLVTARDGRAVLVSASSSFAMTGPPGGADDHSPPSGGGGGRGASALAALMRARAASASSSSPAPTTTPTTTRDEASSRENARDAAIDAAARVFPELVADPNNTSLKWGTPTTGWFDTEGESYAACICAMETNSTSLDMIMFRPE